MSEEPLVLVRHEDAVGVVTLNRPAKRNALDLAMRGAIARAVSALDADAYSAQWSAQLSRAANAARDAAAGFAKSARSLLSTAASRS